MPRAFVVGRARVVAVAEAALDAVTDPAFDPRAEAVVERPVGGARRQRLGADRGSGAGAHASSTATMRGAALLVTADVFLPGWRVTVDGREVPLERVDYLLRGVRVPPGDAPGRVLLPAVELDGGLDRQPAGGARLLAAGVLAGRRRS